jgi:hypothetical protein
MINPWIMSALILTCASFSANAETPQGIAMKGLYLRDFHPYFSEYGDYLEADFKLQNTTVFSVKDIVLECTTDGAMTSDMSVIVIPVFHTVQAHSTVTVRNFDFRYTPPLSERVVCGIIGLTIVPRGKADTARDRPS